MVSEKRKIIPSTRWSACLVGYFYAIFANAPFFSRKFNKKTIGRGYRFGIEFCTPYRFRITAHIRPIVSELRANTVTALFAQK